MCGPSLVAELELAHLEELLQVWAEQLHHHRVELGAPRAARPDLQHPRESLLRATTFQIPSQLLKHFKLYMQKCRKICGLGCVNQVSARV